MRDFDQETEQQRLFRSARPPSSGRYTLDVSNVPANVPNGALRSSATIDTDGKTRRLWTPGDPWSDDFYFGGG
jgi:hypothetical protein